MGRRWGSVRRRMTVFTFNREIYASWSQRGLVWLAPDDDHDPDSDDSDFQHFQQTFSTFSAVAEKKPEPDPAANDRDTDRSSCVHNENILLSADLKNTHSPPIAGADPSVCLRYSPSAERDDEKSLEGPEFSNQNQNPPRFLSAPAESLLKPCCKQQVSDVKVEGREPALTLTQVNPGDYSRKPDNNQVFSYSLKHIKS